MLARNHEEWFAKLDKLAQDGEMRRRIGAGGLATIRKEYTRERCLEQLLEALQEESRILVHA